MINTVEKKYNENGEFACYKITFVNSDRILNVPHSEDNRHYQEIQEWAAIEGNNIIDPGA
jgi:hypothetical protein